VRLREILDIRPGVTALVGGGGKTTLLLALGHALPGRVILCTTTHIRPPEDFPLLLSPSFEDAEKALEAGPVCIGAPGAEGKLGPPALPMAALAEMADYVIVEADGSKRLPLKAHAAWEPVVPKEANQTILVVGLSGLGRPIRESVHRPELYAERLGVSPDTIVTPELEAKFLELEHLHDRVLLNQADTPERLALGNRLAALLRCPAAIGALQKGMLECW
jgi:probable selenium-dependent hydroxylase accessory protein YqeC